MTPDEQNILQYYTNRSLVFQAVVEIELKSLQTRAAHLEQVLETSRQMDQQFGQTEIAQASLPTNLLDQVRKMFPKAASLSDADLKDALEKDPGFLNR